MELEDLNENIFAENDSFFPKSPQPTYESLTPGSSRRSVSNLRAVRLVPSPSEDLHLFKLLEQRKPWTAAFKERTIAWEAITREFIRDHSRFSGWKGQQMKQHVTRELEHIGSVEEETTPSGSGVGMTPTMTELRALQRMVKSHMITQERNILDVREKQKFVEATKKKKDLALERLATYGRSTIHQADDSTISITTDRRSDQSSDKDDNIGDSSNNSKRSAPETLEPPRPQRTKTLQLIEKLIEMVDKPVIVTSTPEERQQEQEFLQLHTKLITQQTQQLEILHQLVKASLQREEEYQKIIDKLTQNK